MRPSPGGDSSDDLSTSGDQTDSEESWDGGLDSSDTEDGMTTTEATSLPSGPGDYAQTIINPDGTYSIDTYSDDLLMQEQDLGTTGSVIDSTTYAYNAMRELVSQTDYSGTETFSYWADGTQKTDQAPGQNAEDDQDPEPDAGDPQTVTLPDGGTQSDVYDDQGNLVSQSGDGVLEASYGYDTSGTGNLTSLTTASGTTSWAYDPDTGQLQSETFADGTKDSYQYNDKGELAVETKPGMSGSFSYDAGGDLTGSEYVDSTSGLLSSTSTLDDQGRPVVTTDADNGKVFSTVDTYTSLGDLHSETFGSAGNSSVTYDYYPITGFGSTGSPDAPQSTTIDTAGGQIASQSYAYDSSTKRLQTINVNGVDITYTYLGNSNQVYSIAVGDVTSTFEPDSSDEARPISTTVTDGSDGTLYEADYTYNADNQIATSNVSQTLSNDDGSTGSRTDALTYTYDPNSADSLTAVSDGSTVHNGLLSISQVKSYSYGYDGAGNFTSISAGSTGHMVDSVPGSVNNVNEYSNFSYNSRHDLTNDGTNTYGYDALDRLISVTPDSVTSGSTQEQYGYDGQGRMLWETVSTWSGSAWTLFNTYHFVWYGDELIAKLDGNNNLLQQYTWGPGQSGQDQVLAITDYTGSSPQTFALVYNASGDVTMMVDATSGTIVANYLYDPYGRLLSSSGPDAALNPFLEKGYWTDSNVSGLAWAQPAIDYGTVRNDELNYGVWMQDDPSGISGGVNLNQYLGGDPINNIDPEGTTQRQATDYLNNLPSDVRGAVHDIVAVQFDGTVPLSSGFTLIAQDEPYRSYIDEAVKLAQQPFDVGQLYGSLMQPNGDVSASALVAAGRQLAPTDQVTAGSAPPDVVNDVLLGQKLANAPQVEHPGGYEDLFGWHVSFCMSCHDSTDAGAAAQFSAAASSTAWEQFAAQMTPSLLLGVGGVSGLFSDVAVSAAPTAESETTLQQLQGAANRAATNVGPGSGPVYGTTVHTAFQGEVEALGNANLATEQSYLNGIPISRGTPGSVRLDVVEGPLKNPTAIYDLKTGSATLTPTRIQQIQSHIPGGSSVPVTEVRP